MSWNHRVVRRRYGDYFEYGIYDVYYDNNGYINAMSMEPRAIAADSLSGMRWVIEKIGEALKKPVVDYDTKEELEIAISEIQLNGTRWTKEDQEYFKDLNPLDDDQVLAEIKKLLDAQ